MTAGEQCIRCRQQVSGDDLLEAKVTPLGMTCEACHDPEAWRARVVKNRYKYEFAPKEPPLLPKHLRCGRDSCGWWA